MTEARKVIFISYVNDDPDAEQVLRALTDDANGLKEQLKPTHDAYDLAIDRNIAAGGDWRRKIAE